MAFETFVPQWGGCLERFQSWEAPSKNGLIQVTVIIVVDEKVFRSVPRAGVQDVTVETVDGADDAAADRAGLR